MINFALFLTLDNLKYLYKCITSYNLQIYHLHKFSPLGCELYKYIKIINTTQKMLY